jgi:hypothetical protein
MKKKIMFTFWQETCVLEYCEIDLLHSLLRKEVTSLVFLILEILEIFTLS